MTEYQVGDLIYGRGNEETNKGRYFSAFVIGFKNNIVKALYHSSDSHFREISLHKGDFDLHQKYWNVKVYKKKK
jgi:hypothetical protein